jgi:hypothetical protein
VQGVLTAQDFDKHIVHSVHGPRLIAQQAAASPEDHRSVRSIEAFNVHSHARSLLPKTPKFGQSVTCKTAGTVARRRDV